MLLGLGGLTALFMLLAPWLMRPFGYEGEQAELVVTLSRILFPTVVALGLSGVVVGILNSYEHFTVPALAPVAWNLVIILGLVLGVPRTDDETTQLYIYAGVGPRCDRDPAPAADPVAPRPGRTAPCRDRLARPRASGASSSSCSRSRSASGLINFNQVVNTFFAARFIDPELAPAAIEAAFRVYMLPQGIFSIAIATVLFPSLSRLAARERRRRVPRDGLARAATDRLPAHSGERGRRSSSPSRSSASSTSAARSAPDQTEVVAEALAAFSLGLTFNGTMLMLNRSFFSLQSPWIPTWIALGNLVLQVGLNAALYRVGVWGIPLATSLVNLAGTAALVVVFRRRIGRLDAGSILGTYGRATVASAVAAGAALGIWYALDEVLGRSLGAQLVSVGTAVVAAAAVYLVAARILRIRELDALLSLVRRSRTR